MKKTFLTFLSIILLSIGVVFNFNIGVNSMTSDLINIEYSLEDNEAKAENGNGSCPCYLTEGGAVDRTYCYDGCLNNGPAYGTKTECSC